MVSCGVPGFQVGTVIPRHPWPWGWQILPKAGSGGSSQEGRPSIGIQIAALRSERERVRIPGSFCLAICVALASTALRAQQLEPTQSGAERSIALPAKFEPAGMTVGQKFRYRLQHSFDLEHVGRSLAGAALDEARNHPAGWGQGWDSFGVRVTSHLGQHVIKQQIMFGVEALAHQSPEHLRSRRTGFKNRLGDSIKYSFMASSDTGKLMPAYARFAGAYGAAYISRAWYPREYHTFNSGFYTGTVSLGIDVGLNVFREFYPDIKRKVFGRP
jgi:hypothetical protein